MPQPTSIKLDFPDGLEPAIYADIHAVLGGNPTSKERSLQSGLGACQLALIEVSIACGMSHAQVLESLNADGHLTDNFRALANAAKVFLLHR